MEVGEKTRSARSKLSTEQQKKRYEATIISRGHYKVSDSHLPINNKLLRDVSFLHPILRDIRYGSQANGRLTVTMPTISDEDVSLVTDKWRVYQAGQVDSESFEWTITGQMCSKRNCRRVNSSIPFFRGCEGNGGGHYLGQLFVTLC